MTQAELDSQLLSSVRDGNNYYYIVSLLKDGANVNARTPKNNTSVLMVASEGENTDLVELLLENGAEINARNKYGRTALMFACQMSSNLEVIKLLLKWNADIYAKSNSNQNALSYLLTNEKITHNTAYEEICTLLSSERNRSTNISNKIDEDTVKQVEQARKKLLDLTMRNSLLNFRHSERASNQVRLVNNNISELYNNLIAGKDIELIPLPELPTEPRDEKTAKFQNAFEMALVTDEKYLAAKEELDKKDYIEEDEEEKLIRELKNRIREQLGLPPLNSLQITKREWALENGINPSYENEISETLETIHARKYIAQTLLYPKEFKSKMLGLKRIVRSDKEEKGTNTFYIALGFLEWYEQTNSEVKHYAPLLLLKLEDLKQDASRRKIYFSSAGDNITTNISLREKLKEFSLNLPDYEEDDTPESYLNKISDLIKSYPKWKVRSYITVGRFIFSRLAMYEDLKIENWDLLLSKKSDLLKSLFDSRINDGKTENLYDIDNDEDVRKYAPILVTGADSSQHSAIVDVMKSNDIVIKGPPGTGKSQTITNLIANALYANKRVLFMAEKKAALDVVFSRLKQAGLEDYCFELHSDKTNISHVRGGLEKSYDRYMSNRRCPQTPIIKTKIEKLISEKKELREYYDTLQKKVGVLGKTLFELIWQAKELEEVVNIYPPSFKNIVIKSVLEIKPIDFENDNEALDRLEQLYNAYQNSLCSLDNWKDIKSCPVKIQEIQSLLQQVELILEDIKSTLNYKNDLFFKDCIDIPMTFSETNDLLDIAKQYNKLCKDSNIDNSWPLIVEQNNINDEIKAFAKCLHNYKNLYQNIANTYKNPLEAMNADNKFEDIYSKLQKTETNNRNLKEIKGLNSQLLKELQYWEDSAKLREITSLIHKRDDLTIGDICSVMDLLKEFSDIASILPIYAQNFEMFKPYNWSVLDKAEDTITDLISKQKELSAIFDIDSAIDIQNIESQLNKAIKSISSAGFFTLFNKDYKEAKSLYKLLALSPKAKKDTILQNFKSLLKYIKNHKDLSENTSFVNVIGTYFKGIKTEIKEIQKIHHFYQKIYDAEAKYGENISQRLRAFFSDKENFENFQKIATYASTFDNLDLTLFQMDFYQSYNDYLVRLKQLKELISSLSDDFLNLFNTDEIDVASILENRLLLSQLKDVITNIKGLNDAISPYLPELAKEKDSDIDKFEKLSTLSNMLKENSHVKDVEGWLQIVSNNLLPELISNLENYCQRISEINKQISQIEKLFIFGGLSYSGEGYISQNLETMQQYFELLYNNKDAIYNVCAFYDALSRVENTRYENVIDYLQKHNYPFNNLSKTYDYLIYYDLAKELKDDKWSAYIPNEMSQIAENIRKLEEDVYQLNGKILIESLNKIKVPEGINSTRVSEKTDLQLILHQISGHCRSIPLRRFINRAGRAIQALKPCFLMSPIAVAQYIPPRSIDFDLLIIDEASQMYFEEALGGIFRAKQIVVVGDDKQLPPTPFFQKNSAQEDEFDEEEEKSDDLSILDTCIVRGFEHRELLWHYRSKDGSLIEFSNTNFYNDNLKIFPSPVVSSNVNGVQRIYVHGIYKNRQNEDEANAIITEVKRFVRNFPDRSLGIATINSTQKALLDKKCDLLYEQDEKFREYYDKWNNGLEAFFVKNLENVQGDERDYIYVSTVYGPESEGGRVLQRFGPINGKYGHRRLNVLFTRAKYGLKIFTSLKADDIVVSDASTIGLKTFRDYLLYAETGRIVNGHISNRDFDSDFEKMVYDILTSKGYEVDKQVGVKGFFIDLAVKHPLNKAFYALGIECDGAPYHSTKSARDRDCIRQSVLESLGWKIYRIWSKDWFFNTQKEVEKLLKHLEDICQVEPKIEYATNNNYMDIHEEEKEIKTFEETLDGDFVSTTQPGFDFSIPIDKKSKIGDNFQFNFNQDSIKAITKKVSTDENDEIEDDDDTDVFGQPIVKKSNLPEIKKVEVYDTIKYVRLSDDTEHTVQITTQQSIPEKGLINEGTALAQALLDAEEGEEVEVNDKQILVKEIIKAPVNIKKEEDISEDDDDDEDDNEFSDESNHSYQSVRKSPKSPTTFSMLQIPVGSELTFIMNSSIIAITVNDRNGIRLKDKPISGSLSSVTRILAVKFGYTSKSYAGPRWWKYKGKILADIREEIEKNNNSISQRNDMGKHNDRSIISAEYDQIVKIGTNISGYFRQATYFYLLVVLGITREELAPKIREIYQKYGIILNNGVLSHEMQTAKVCLTNNELTDIIGKEKLKESPITKIIEKIAFEMQKQHLNYHSLFENKK